MTIRPVHIDDDVLLLVQRVEGIQRVQLASDLVQEIKDGGLLIGIRVLVDDDDLRLGTLVLLLIRSVQLLLAGVLVLLCGTRTTAFSGGLNFLLFFLLRFFFNGLLLFHAVLGWWARAAFVLILVLLVVVDDDHLLVVVSQDAANVAQHTSCLLAQIKFLHRELLIREGVCVVELSGASLDSRSYRGGPALERNRC